MLKDVRSPERLLDQTTLRLHTHIADLSQHQLELLKALHSDDGLLCDRNVLLVDDDMRNVFAMTSVLERYGMTVLPAESGPIHDLAPQHHASESSKAEPTVKS